MRPAGFRHSEATRAAMRKPKSPEHKAKIAAAMSQYCASREENQVVNFKGRRRSGKRRLPV